MTPEEQRAWVDSLRPGDEVCDSRNKHQRVAYVDPAGDVVTFLDGHSCSPFHECRPADHPQSDHETDE